MTTAQSIALDFPGARSVQGDRMIDDACAAHGAAVDQDWDAETTRYGFGDGSAIVVSGPLFSVE